MCTCKENIMASNDDFIYAAGFDPLLYPSSITVGDFIIGRREELKKLGVNIGDGFNYIHNQLVHNNFIDLKKILTLEERFQQYGISIVNIEGGYFNNCGYIPKIVQLSNGMVLQEVVDECRKIDKLNTNNTTFKPGFDQVYFYKVILRK